MTTLIILPTYGFYDDDLLNIIKILRDRTIAVCTKDKKIAKGKKGTKVIPDLSFEEILYLESNPFEKLIIIADEGWKELYNLDIKTIVAGFNASDKEIILISLAPILLAKFGFLYGRIVTYNSEDFPEYQKELLNLGVKLTDLPVYKDGNIISCKGREAIFELKKYI